jgi:hypothetical protein
MRWAQFPRFATAAATVTLVALVGAAGCFTSGNQCQQDYDCGGGDVCANTHECVGAGDVHRIAVRWTVRGNPASETTCAGIASLEITIVDDVSSATTGYAPVPCPTGIFTFDKLPVGFNRLTLNVNGTDGATESFNANIADGTDILFDLGLGSLPVDAGVP